MTRGPAINGRTLDFLRHMRGHTQTAQILDKPCAVISFVRTKSDPMNTWNIRSHGKSSLAFSRPGRLGDAGVHDQTIAVLHQDMAHEVELGLLALTFPV